MSRMPSLEVPRRIVDEHRAMPPEPPLISCLMVTRGRLVPTQFALDCYRRQTWPNRELVVVCDAADSELPAFIAGLGDPTIRYVNTAHATLGELRNVSVEASRGTFLCQWDDDDLYHSQRLEFQYGELMASGKAAHVLSRWLMWWPEQQRLAISSRRFWEGSMLVHRHALGSYQAVARREDTQVIADMRERGNRIAHSDQPFAYCYIVHGANTYGTGHHKKMFAKASEIFSAEEYAGSLEQFETIFPMRGYREALARLGRGV